LHAIDLQFVRHPLDTRRYPAALYTINGNGGDTLTTENLAPLEGVRVLELGQLIAGPYCGQVFADFGADVVKVEVPGVGDPMRKWGVCVDGRSLSWSVIARGKRLVTADLKSPEGIAFVTALLTKADIVIENFRPGTLERLGLGWEELSALNPRLIMIRVSGYGQTGPYAKRAGYGSIGEAMGGLRYLTGEPGRPPTRIGVSIGDELAGLHAAIGGLMALMARARTGLGQVVDVSIYESVLAVTEALVPDFAVGGVTRERSGSTLPGVAPSNLYPTLDGEQVIMAANQDSVFARLAKAMGRPELATSEKFGSHIGRGQNQTELDELITRWTSTRATEDLVRLLDEHAVPVGKVYRARDMLSDPQFQSRASIVEVIDPALGPIPMQNVTPRLVRTPGTIKWPGGALSQHQDEVRVDWLEGSAGSGD
jgi:crotonobetainyl-CoA:carnitine CoA-transferase CaiB-like acyl-CoA transferase